MNDYLNTRGISHIAYPGIGRSLTQNDINRRVVRVYPMNSDFSYVAKSYDDERAPLLKCIDKEKLILLIGFDEITLGANWLDQNWLTVDEFYKKTLSLEPTVIYTHDSDPF